MGYSWDELTDMSYKVSERFQKVNVKYLTLMGKQIKEIGKLSPSNLHQIQQMIRMGQNINYITNMLIAETGLALKDIYRIYDESGMREYGDLKYLYDYQHIPQASFVKNIALQNHIKSVQNLTLNTFTNMANTTSIQADYKAVLDYAITAVTEGVDDYNSVMRSILKKYANKGMRVQYASGYTRRLDSACRMNILEGVRQVNAGVREQAGKEYGADGVEISAHALCANDHIPVQGKQYTLKRFNEINSQLNRQIGTCNCKHTTFPILIGVSKPAYSKKELKKYKDYSQRKVTVNGVEMTRYEASQAMRQAETKIRYQKEEIITLESAGIDTTKERSKLNDLQNGYIGICNQSGLKPQEERTYVVDFK